MSNFYVYIHRRVSDNSPFYVGKGKDKRAYDFSKRNEYWKRVHQKHGTKVEIVFDNLDEKTAFQCEIDTILEMKYFGYALCNMTTGGEGVSGSKQSLETRQLKSQQMSNRVVSQQTKDRIGAASRSRRQTIVERNSDKNIYVFLHDDGNVFTGTRLELCSFYALNHFALRTLFITNAKTVSSQGWSVAKAGEELKDVQIRKDEKLLKMLNSRSRDKNTYSFEHTSGAKFKGTRADFSATHNIPLRCISPLFWIKPPKTVSGWKLIKDIT